MTPDDVLRSIRDTRAELLRGPGVLHDAELAAERAEATAQLAVDKAMLTAEGSIPDRAAQARAVTVEVRDGAFVARAVHTRIKAKIRALESALVSLQAELKWMKDEGA